MLFNSFEFLVFFTAVTLLFFLLPHKYRWFHLLLASFVFYMAFLPVYVLILLATIIVDYFAGIFIERSAGKKRKGFLVLSLIANIGFLCFFKYYDFIIHNLNILLHIHLPLLNELWLSSRIIAFNNYVNTLVNQTLGTDLRILRTIILPIGLSFHTFQAMSYTIEVYKGKQKAEKHFGLYALYVMFYPQLVAGPIERPQHILPQLHSRKYFNWENLLVGLRLMAWGLFKKAVIADRLSVYVGLVYSDPQQYHWLNLVIATVFFAIQIYCDFSGYSDMAIGAAKTIGYDLMINFRRPYFATSIKEFWERWHISLTSWFRDYLYIPLGGNRKGFRRQLINLAIVFLISGLWHGANWTFIIWGALHAGYSIIYLLYNRLADKYKPVRNNLIWKLSGWLVTFLLVCFAWIFFRATDTTQAFDIAGRIFTRSSEHPFKWILMDASLRSGFGIMSMLIILVCGSYLFLAERVYQPKLTELNYQPRRDIAFISGSLFCIIVFGVFIKASFIYFQF